MYHNLDQELQQLSISNEANHERDLPMTLKYFENGQFSITYNNPLSADCKVESKNDSESDQFSYI